MSRQGMLPFLYDSRYTHPEISDRACKAKGEEVKMALFRVGEIYIHCSKSWEVEGELLIMNNFVQK